LYFKTIMNLINKFFKLWTYYWNILFTVSLPSMRSPLPSSPSPPSVHSPIPPPVTAKKVSNDYLYNVGSLLRNNTIITRHSQKTFQELDNFEKNTPLNIISIKLNKDQYAYCYGCNKQIIKLHPVYIYSCVSCGNKFQKNRNLSRDLNGHVAVVTGGRTKLGHQIVLKLLRAGSDVIPTTRNNEEIFNMFKSYEDSKNWIHKLHLYKSLDFDVPNLESEFDEFSKWIEKKFGFVSIVINSAAQTIRCREKKVKIDSSVELNRYGDSLHVKPSDVNSWQMTLLNTPQYEMEEVMRINAIAPFLLIKSVYRLINESKIQTYIVNVHAREGLFGLSKSQYHIHTNMGKSALHMVTLCLAQNRWKTKNNFKVCINGCDPGWISVDEYYEHDKPFIVPPLDEIDGASRILYPIFKNQIYSSGFTQRHFDIIKF